MKWMDWLCGLGRVPIYDACVGGPGRLEYCRILEDCNWGGLLTWSGGWPNVTCLRTFRNSIFAMNFCSSFNFLNDGTRDNKKDLSSSISTIFLQLFLVTIPHVGFFERCFCCLTFVVCEPSLISILVAAWGSL
jgi:hypothetical protein